MVLGRSHGLIEQSWAALGAYVGGLGPLLGPMLALWACLGGLGPLSVPMLAVLGLSWGRLRLLLALCGRSWAALGAYVGGLGPLSGPMLAVLGRSWVPCWRSWSLLGPMLAVLDGLGAEVVGLESDQGEKRPKPERERDLGRKRTGLNAPMPRSILRIFSIDMYIYTHICLYAA